MEIIVGIGSLGIFASGAGQSHTFSPFIPVISKDLKFQVHQLQQLYDSHIIWHFCFQDWEVS